VAGALDLAATTEERQALLAALGAQACPSALRLAVDLLDEPDAACAAGRAAVAIVRSLPRDDAETIAAALRSVVRACREPEVVQGATGLLREVLRPVNLALAAKASSPDGLEPDGASGPDQAAIDGNLDTYWDETDDQPLYRLRLEFPGPTEVASIRVVGHAYRSHTPRDFDVLLDGKVVK
jgi:hypothetical protein